MQNMSEAVHRMEGEMRTNQWELQASDVCFGAKDEQFGVFELKNHGLVKGLRLVHKSG